MRSPADPPAHRDPVAAAERSTPAGAPSAGRGSADSVARWTVPSLGNYCLLLLLLLVSLQSWRFLQDSDTGWHIRSGDWMLEHRQVLDHDVFSYTLPAQRWVDFEWLADVAMSAVHHARGLGGLVGASVLVLAVSYALLYEQMRRRGADLITSLALTLLAAFASLVHWLARPHLLSIPLLLVWSWIVEHHRRTGSRWIYATPLLIALWANLHSAFVVTFPLLAAYAVGVWAEQIAAGRAWSRDTVRVALPYLIVGVLSVLAGLLTPYGAGLYGEVTRFMSHRTLIAGILEFRSPDFHTTDGKLVEWILVLAALAAAHAAAHRRFVETGVALVLCHLMLDSQRHVTVAVMVLMPMIGEQLSQAIGTATARLARGSGRMAGGWQASREWYQGMNRTDRQLTGGAAYALTLGAALVAVIGGGADAWLAPQFSPRLFPVQAVDAIERAGPSGPLGDRLFAHDQYGGYLIYRLAPRGSVFVDGRYHLYGRSAIPDEMAAVMDVEPAWPEILARWRVDWVLVPRDTPIARVLAGSPEWSRAYGDRTATLFRRGVRRS